MYVINININISFIFIINIQYILIFIYIIIIDVSIYNIKMSLVQIRSVELILLPSVKKLECKYESNNNLSLILESNIVLFIIIYLI